MHRVFKSNRNENANEGNATIAGASDFDFNFEFGLGFESRLRRANCIIIATNEAEKVVPFESW